MLYCAISELELSVHMQDLFYLNNDKKAFPSSATRKGLGTMEKQCQRAF